MAVTEDSMEPYGNRWLSDPDPTPSSPKAEAYTAYTQSANRWLDG